MGILDNFKNPWAANSNSQYPNVLNNPFNTLDEDNVLNQQALQTNVFEGNEEVLGRKALNMPEEFLLEIKCNDPEHINKYIKENEVVFISSTPQMPTIDIEITMGLKVPTINEFAYDKLFVIVEVEYKVDSGDKNRNDSFRCPMDNNYSMTFDFNKLKILNNDEIIEIPNPFSKPNNSQKINNRKITQRIDWYNIFIGGKATIKVFSDNSLTKKLKEFTFHIRGKNPTKQQVKAYLEQQGYLNRFWFIHKMLISESGSEDLTVMQQFKEAGKPTAIDTKAGLPYWGTPDGWGMGQIDFKNNEDGHDKNWPTKAPMECAWNWKKNIDWLVKRLSEEKCSQLINSITNKMKNFYSINKNALKQFEKIDQMEGNNNSEVKFINCETDIAEMSTLNEYMDKTRNNEKSDNVKSVLDADLIKRYNGGRYLYDVSISTNNKPEWTLNRLNDYQKPFNYVERVCAINE